MPELSSRIAPLTSTDRLRWSLAAFGVALAATEFTIIQFLQSWDFVEVLFSILIAPAFCLVVILAAVVYAVRRRPRTGISLFMAALSYGLVSWLLLINSADLHGSILWSIHAKVYKAQVLAQQSGSALKHIEWFGWGLAGSDTSMYLAYDPGNSLAHRDPFTGQFGSIHCDVSSVRRLEDHWYAITFFTNTGWDSSCDSGQSAPSLR